MAYARSKETKIVSDARKRYAGMKEIDAQAGSEVEYGTLSNPLNSTKYKDKLDKYATKQNDLNQILSTADEAANQLKALEKEIGSFYSRVLKGAVSQFGEDSNEVEMLGGTRKSERKRPTKKVNP